MDVNVYRLAFFGFERGVGALEAEVGVRAQHAFCDSGSERVRNYIWEDISWVNDSVLLDVSCAETEVVMCCRAIVECLRFGHHAGVQGVEMGS